MHFCTCLNTYIFACVYYSLAEKEKNDDGDVTIKRPVNESTGGSIERPVDGLTGGDFNFEVAGFLESSGLNKVRTYIYSLC
jgi:hypothetical protein